MSSWLGIVLAPSGDGGDEMASRLATCLHPVAGRPLVWHVASALAAARPAPGRILVVADVELSADVFADLPVEVAVIAAPRERERSHLEADLPWGKATHALVVDGAAHVTAAALSALVASEPGHWLGGDDGEAVAAWLLPQQVGQLYRLDEPLAPPNGVLGDSERLATGHRSFVVRHRDQLAVMTRRVRDRLVARLMDGGTTFLLPDSVLVDVDVRVGRDTVIYPGVVLEGQTTIGDESVIGPGCRIIASWVGSGVELKGWNYLAHTSIRNRAILEPYVRRGFD